MKLVRPLHRLQLPQIPKWIPITILLLALIGFGDAIFLTVEHYQGVIPPCSISGCEYVLSSSYAEVFGIPVSLLGSIFYLIILVSLFIYLDIKNNLIRDIAIKIVIAISSIGFFVSLIFISIMLFVISAICIYCMVSDVITILIAIFAWHIIFVNYKKLK